LLRGQKKKNPEKKRLKLQTSLKGHGTYWGSQKLRGLGKKINQRSGTFGLGFQTVRKNNFPQQQILGVWKLVEFCGQSGRTQRGGCLPAPSKRATQHLKTGDVFSVEANYCQGKKNEKEPLEESYKWKKKTKRALSREVEKGRK